MSMANPAPNNRLVSEIIKIELLCALEFIFLKFQEEYMCKKTRASENRDFLERFRHSQKHLQLSKAVI